MAKATSPEKYVSVVKKPTDFDEFWNGVLAQASKIPLEPETVPDPLRSSKDVEVFQVFYNSLDNVRIAAWYCLPRNRSGRLPAILSVPGYVSDPPIPKDWARLGYATLSVAPRGKVRSNRQFNPGYPGLLTYGIVDRNVYSYRGFYVDAWRGVDYLLSRQEVDSSRIGVTGSSQGGGLTVTTSAMRPQIKAAAAGAPYLCGYMDAIELTHTYPYQEINDYLRLHPESRESVEQTLAYFDGICFAGKIRCPIIVNIGLQDNVCPPETGYALFNAISSKDKKLYTYDGHGHDAGSYKHSAIVREFFSQHLM
jgi:cephalosporin-C deacetylase